MQRGVGCTGFQPDNPTPTSKPKNKKIKPKPNRAGLQADNPTRTALFDKRRKELVTRNHKGYLKYEDAMSKVVPAWKRSEEYQLCQTKALEVPALRYT